MNRHENKTPQQSQSLELEQLTEISDLWTLKFGNVLRVSTNEFNPIKSYDMLIINKEITLNFVISAIDFLSHGKNNAMKAE